MTVINPGIPGGQVVYCDDVRQEVGGKLTYVGVYTGVMYVQQIPATLPQICAVVNYRESPQDSGSVPIRLLYEVNGEDLLLGEMTLEIAEEFKLPPSEEFVMREIRCIMKVSPFEILEEGRLKVRAYKGDDEVRLGALIIARAPSVEGQVSGLDA